MNAFRMKSLTLFLIFFLFFYLYQNDYLTFLNKDVLEQLLQEQSLIAGIIFVFVYALITVLFIPVGPFVVLAGVIFGAWYGMLYILLGAVIGGVISLLISRYYLRTFFKDLCARRFPRIQQYTQALEKNETSALFFLRLTPIVPSSILNYSCGLTYVSLKTFIWTFIGVIPGTLFYTYLGDSLMNFTRTNVVVIIVFAVAMITLTYSVRNHLPQKT